MALALPTLIRGLTELAARPPRTAAEAAQKAARVYDDYARLAQAAGLFPTLTGTVRLRLQWALQTAWSAAAGTALTSAQAWSLGLTSYWQLPPVVFGAGVVVSSGIPLSVPCLAAVSVPSISPSVPVARVASCLDTATRSVLVLIPPNPTPSPLV